MMGVLVPIGTITEENKVSNLSSVHELKRSHRCTVEVLAEFTYLTPSFTAYVSY